MKKFIANNYVFKFLLFSSIITFIILVLMHNSVSKFYEFLSGLMFIYFGVKFLYIHFIGKRKC